MNIPSLPVNNLINDLAGRIYELPRSITADLPFSVRGVRESFSTFSLHDWLFWMILITPLVLLLGILWWYGRQWLAAAPLRPKHSPRTLFEQILAALNLPAEDKKLLRRLARGAGLTHPALCLLSPALLDQARQIWRQRQGPRRVPPEQYHRLDDIALRLFDYYVASDRPSPPHLGVSPA